MMLKFLKYLFFTLILVILATAGAGYYFIKNFDADKYKSKIEKVASSAINREVKIAGNLKIALSLIPTIEINELSIGNPDWAKAPHFFQAEKIYISFDIMPLLEKQISINAVEINKPDLQLEVSKNGEENWNFSSPEEIAEKASAAVQEEEMSSEEIAAVSLAGFMISEAEISDAKVEYNDYKSNQKQLVLINKFEADEISDGSNLGANFDVQYENYKIVGNFSTATLDDILQKKPDLPIKLDAKINDTSLNFDGTISDLSPNAKIKGKLTAHNPDQSFGAPETALNADITADTKTITTNISMLNIATNVISGSISVNISKKTPYIYADIKSKIINLESFQKNKTTAFVPQIISVAHAQENSFDLNQKIDYALLKTINADAKIKINRLVIQDGLDIDGIDATAKLNNGVLTLNPLTLTFGDGQMDISSVVDANKQNITLNLSGTNLKVQKIADILDLSGENKNPDQFGILSGGDTDTSVKLTTQGATYADLIKNMNGETIAIVNSSKIQLGNFSLLSSNLISQVAQTLQVYKPQSGKATLNCAVLRADIKDGVASFPKGVAFDTKKFVLISSGTLNLSNQQIDFSMKPTTKKVSDTNISQAISSLLRIKGTLNDPKISIDDAGAIKTIVGIVTTGPVALGSQMLLDGDDAPCHTALAGTTFANKFPAATGVKSNTKKAYSETSDVISAGINNVADSTSDIIKGAADGLKNILKKSKKK